MSFVFRIILRKRANYKQNFITQLARKIKRHKFIITRFQKPAITEDSEVFNCSMPQKRHRNCSPKGQQKVRHSTCVQVATVSRIKLFSTTGQANFCSILWQHVVVTAFHGGLIVTGITVSRIFTTKQGTTKENVFAVKDPPVSDWRSRYQQQNSFLKSNLNRKR